MSPQWTLPISQCGSRARRAVDIPCWQHVVISLSKRQASGRLRTGASAFSPRHDPGATGSSPTSSKQQCVLGIKFQALTTCIGQRTWGLSRLLQAARQMHPRPRPPNSRLRCLDVVLSRCCWKARRILEWVKPENTNSPVEYRSLLCFR